MPHKSPGWRRAAPYPGYSALSGGWLTPYPAYGRLLNLSYQTVAQLRRPAQAPRRAAGQAVSNAVPVLVPDGGYALSGLRKAAEPELSNSCSTL
ncbi:hypothetical protein DMQ35_10805 [Klebsiella quasipneumoniae]|nr:hypothetical protein DMQ35_10805 [Klebsiella quasipneumoniae]